MRCARRLCSRSLLLALLALLAVGAGCGKGDKSDGRAADPAKPVGFDQLTVTAGGKPVAMKRAFVKRVSPDQWRVQVSDGEASCADLLAGVAQEAPGTTGFVVSIARRIQPGGGDALVVTELWGAGAAGQRADALAATATIAGSTDRGRTSVITLGKLAVGTLQVAGAFPAVGCGDQPVPDEGQPKAPHPSTASVTIAGKRLHLFNATRTGDAIVLTSGPRDCTSPTVPAQATIERKGGLWRLTGTWFAAPSETREAGALQITAGERGKSDDGPTVALTLSGTGKLGDYPVSFDGAIEAIDCAK